MNVYLRLMINSDPDPDKLILRIYPRIFFIFRWDLLNFSYEVSEEASQNEERRPDMSAA